MGCFGPGCFLPQGCFITCFDLRFFPLDTLVRRVSVALKPNFWDPGTCQRPDTFVFFPFSSPSTLEISLISSRWLLLVQFQKVIGLSDPPLGRAFSLPSMAGASSGPMISTKPEAWMTLEFFPKGFQLRYGITLWLFFGPALKVSPMAASGGGNLTPFIYICPFGGCPQFPRFTPESHPQKSADFRRGRWI